MSDNMNGEVTFTISSNNLNEYSSYDIESLHLSNLQFTATPNLQSASIYQLAKAFLSIESMTNKKLQKLCYYAKAWYLALNDTNIVNEPFQAWIHGAVQPALYQKYRHYGFSSIPKVLATDDIPEEFLAFAHEIYQAYGHLTGDELETINHQEEPWIKARGSRKPWEKCENVISEEDMKNFYRKMMSE